MITATLTHDPGNSEDVIRIEIRIGIRIRIRISCNKKLFVVEMIRCRCGKRSSFFSEGLTHEGQGFKIHKNKYFKIYQNAFSRIKIL